MSYSKYLVLALVFALLNMGAIFFIFGAKEYGDSQDYIEVINFFRGEPSEITPWRMLRPLGPLMAAPFEFFGEGGHPFPAQNAALVVNLNGGATIAVRAVVRFV